MILTGFVQRSSTFAIHSHPNIFNVAVNAMNVACFEHYSLAIFQFISRWWKSRYIWIITILSSFCIWSINGTHSIRTKRNCVFSSRHSGRTWYEFFVCAFFTFIEHFFNFIFSVFVGASAQLSSCAYVCAYNWKSVVLFGLLNICFISRILLRN